MPKGKQGFQKGNTINNGKHSKNEFKKGHVVTKKTRESVSKTQKGRKHQPQEGFQKGDKNHGWIEDRSLLEYPNDWTDTLKESIRQRDSYICQECGIHQDELEMGQVKKLDVHHIDYIKENCNPNNLVALCRKCHLKTNHNREYWQQYFQTEK